MSLSWEVTASAAAVRRRQDGVPSVGGRGCGRLAGPLALRCPPQRSPPVPKEAACVFRRVSWPWKGRDRAEWGFCGRRWCSLWTKSRFSSRICAERDCSSWLLARAARCHQPLQIQGWGPPGEGGAPLGPGRVGRLPFWSSAQPCGG